MNCFSSALPMERWQDRQLRFYAALHVYISFLFSGPYVQYGAVNGPLQRGDMLVHFLPCPYGMTHVLINMVPNVRCVCMCDSLHTYTYLPLCFLPPPFVVLIQFQCLTNFRLHNLQDVFSITQGSSSASNLPLFCITKLELSENDCKKKACALSILCSRSCKNHI